MSQKFIGSQIFFRKRCLISAIFREDLKKSCVIVGVAWQHHKFPCRSVFTSHFTNFKCNFPVVKIISFLFLFHTFVQKFSNWCLCFFRLLKRTRIDHQLEIVIDERRESMEGISLQKSTLTYYDILDRVVIYYAILNAKLDIAMRNKQKDIEENLSHKF